MPCSHIEFKLLKRLC